MRRLLLSLGLILPLNGGALAQSQHDGEIDCIARAIYFEAGAEPREGQIGVAMVVVNRMRDKRFPATACAVIDDGFYFPRDKAITEQARWVGAWRIATEVLADRLEVASLRGALFFHGLRETPDWRFRLRKLAQIGGHIFYGDR